MKESDFLKTVKKMQSDELLEREVYLRLLNSIKNEHDKENKEQDFETTFLHGHDGSQCIYYTNEKCLYYNDCESPCHHCHHYTTKIRN